MQKESHFSRVTKRTPKKLSFPETALRQIYRERFERKRKRNIRRNRKIMRLLARRSVNLGSAKKSENRWARIKRKVREWWLK